MDNICWMRNTYYIPDHMSVGEARDELNIDWELAYYQWVPIILGENKSNQIKNTFIRTIIHHRTLVEVQN